MLNKLIDSKDTGGLVGIVCSVLGEGIFITAIEDIQEQHGKEQVIILKPYDVSGHTFSKTHVLLSEIRAVAPFKAFYRDPLVCH